MIKLFQSLSILTKLCLFAFLLFVGSCQSVYTFNYKPNEASEKIYMPVKVDVNANISKTDILSIRRFKDLDKDLKHVLKEEMKQVFSDVNDNKHMFHNIYVDIDVKKISFREKMWPIFFPSFVVLSYFGGPMFRGVGEVDYSINLFDIKGNLIKKYNQKAVVKKFSGWYWGKKHLTPGSESYVLYKASAEAMDKLKKEIIADKATILSYKFSEESLVKRDTIRIVEKEKVYVEVGKAAYQFEKGSDVDVDIPVNNSKFKDRFALIIGNEDYATHQLGLNTEANVDFARNDASAFKLYAINTLGVPEENVIFLLDGTLAKMQRAIEKAKSIMKYTEGEAELIVYYAGHGLPDEVSKDAYLIPVDVDGKSLNLGIKLDEFYEKLTMFPAKKVIVFLDACFTGGARNEELVASRGFKIIPRKSNVKGNLVVFTSSSSSQSSYSYEEKEHGLFTYFLLKKLQESKGEITLGALAEFLNKKVAIQSVLINDKEQEPVTIFSSEVKEVWEDWKLITDKDN